MEPDDPGSRVSHETIYAAIYTHRRAAPWSRKPCGLSTARRRSSGLAPGHWEGDLLKGAFNRSSVGTLVERKTRFVVLCKMDGNTAEAALEGFTRQMKRLPAALRKSMTYDRGSELACHPELARRLKIDIWFADPHAPWQRRSNENTNGLLRQFIPKGTDLSDASQTWLKRRGTAHERTAAQDTGVENPSRNHGRRNRGLQIKRCTCRLKLAIQTVHYARQGVFQTLYEIAPSELAVRV